jgi:uncharacterized membrane protein HdeD (DUF308 family)
MAETIGGAFAGHVASRLWGWTLVRGLIAIALGICAIMWPLSALFAFTLLFAAYAFVDGVASMIAGFQSAGRGERWGWLVFRGIVGELVGVLFVLMPLVATAAYAYFCIALLAIWSIFGGLFEIIAAVRLRKEIEGEWLLVISGLVTLALGGAIIAIVLPSPGATLLSAAWIIAFYAFIAGSVLIVQAFRLKRLAE